MTTLKQRYDYLCDLSKEYTQKGDFTNARMIIECAADQYDLMQQCKEQLLNDYTHQDNENTITISVNNFYEHED